MAQLIVVNKLSVLSASPDAKASTEGTKVVVELDDGDGKVQLSFSPYQALRVTTADCFSTHNLDMPEGMISIPRAVLEIKSSEWISELKESLAQVDEGAIFLDRSRHFLIPACDDFIEVVAWDLEVRV